MMGAVVVALSLAAAPAHAAQAGEGPSRPALKGCVWERLSDAKVGILAWVQRCDFGFRRIGLLMKGRSLSVAYSDGGEAEPLVDVIDLRPGETEVDGVKRVFVERTDKNLAARCHIAPYEREKTPAGVARFTFVPDEAYRKELEAAADASAVPPPPCGDWGESPDGIQYFETQPASGARRVLFVRVGQDEPLFDENTLKILK